MSFMIQALRFIIFGFLISNIVTKPENLLVSFDKHINVETKENIYNTTSGNNIHIITKKYDDFEYHDNYDLAPHETIDIIIFILVLACLTIVMIICIWAGTRWQCNIQCIRRNCSSFRGCCVECIRYFPNNPPPPELVVHYRSQAADYQDIYQMPGVSKTQ